MQHDNLIAVSASGRALGEDNPRSLLTNRDVRNMRAMREADPQHWTCAKLGEAFGCSARYAEKIIKYEKRCQAPSEYRRAK